MKENQRGGKRPGSGRRPLENPKMLVSIYVEKQLVESKGGKDGFRQFVYSLLPSHEPTTAEVKSKVVAKDLTKPTHEIKPQEQPKTNFSIDTTQRAHDALKTPKTLDELKAMCPKELTGIDRSVWIAEERKKYNL